MSQSMLDLIFRTKKTGEGAKQAEAEMKRLKQASREMAGAFESMSDMTLAAEGALIGLGLAFLGSVPQMVQQGIAIERAETALAAYAGSAEAAAEVTERVQEAAGKGISEFAAMQNATRLLSMGLAENAEEAERLTQIAVTLGSTMGKGPQEAFEEFTLLLANQSILRLDTFGISGAAVREIMEELGEETGETDRQTRFLAATMEIAEEKMRALEAAGYQATSSVDRLGAYFKDAKASVSGFFADGLVPILDGMFAVTDKGAELREEIVNTSTSFAEASQRITELREKMGVMGVTIQYVTQEELDAAKATQMMNYDLEMAARWYQGAGASAAEAGEEFEGAGESMTLSTDEIKAALGDLKLFVDGPLGEAVDKFNEKQGELREKAEEFRAKIAELEGRSYLTKDQKEELAGLQEDLGEVTQAMVENADAHDEATRRILFNLLQQRAAVDGVSAAELGLLTSVAEKWGLIDSATATATRGIDEALTELNEGGSIQDAIAAFEELKAVIDGLPTSKTITFDYSIPPIPGAPAYHNHMGRDFTVGGPMGVDRTPVFFWATRGETVTVTPEGGRNPGGGGVTLQGDIIFQPGAGANGAQLFDEFVEELNRRGESAKRGGYRYLGK